jgi:hypothetical protein
METMANAVAGMISSPAPALILLVLEKLSGRPLVSREAGAKDETGNGD